jgi:hypothetical protein
MKSEFEIFKNFQYLAVTWCWFSGRRKSLKFKLQNAPLDHPLIQKVTQAGSQKWSLGSAVHFVSYLICTIKGI